MARIDSFLAQLMAYEAEALLVESGDNLYLVKSDQRMPLMQVRAGAYGAPPSTTGCHAHTPRSSVQS